MRRCQGRVGASSTDRLITAFPDNAPFRAAIQESSQASVSPAPSNNGTLSWLALVDALNCSSAKSGLACVRSKPAAQIKSIEEHLVLAFDPTIDDVTTLSDPQQAKAEHRIASIPVLTGTNSQEGRLF